MTEMVQLARVLAGSTETLLTHPKAFGLETASPLQRAICRIADGIPLGELARDHDVITAVGDIDALPASRPRELAVLSGIRVAKSITAACLAVNRSQTVDVSGIRVGEEPRVPIVSLTKDLADVVFGHLAGSIMNSPYLRSLMVGEPTADSIRLRHPHGPVIEIKVTAGARAGASLVARWLAAAIFDEFPRMLGGDEGVVNWDDSKKAVVGRVLPGGTILDIGSPWAPYGPAYTMVQDHWKRPTSDLVVIKAPAPAMNPVYWTHDRCREVERASPDAYQTDVLAEFAAPEESLFAGPELERCTRTGPMELPPDEYATYWGAMDPAMRRNAWTFVVVTRQGPLRRVALARQWMGTKVEPLSPKAVLGEIAAICRAYRIKVIETDRYAADALRAIAADEDLGVVQTSLTDRQKTERYLAMKIRLAEGVLDIPPDPILRSDLQRLRRRATHQGVSIVLPQTSDGRHCDYAPALMLALHHVLDDVRAPDPEPGTEEAMRAEQERMRKNAERAFGRPRWKRAG